MADETEIANKRMQLFYRCLQQMDEACKTPANAVDFRMHKCRKQLKKIIEQHPEFKELIFVSKQA